MTPKQVKDIFDKLPSKRRKVLVGFLAGHSREKIMIDAHIPSDAALTGHLKELYKNFHINTGWNDADDRRSGARKLPLLISLFARCMPELISDHIAEVPDGVEQEEAIAKSHRESVESDAGSIEERYFRATSNFDSLEPLERKSRIQVLEEIASNKDFPRYHWKVMEFLAAFVRRKAPRREEEEGDEERSPELREDIQAALTVIGHRDWKKDPKKDWLNLSNTDIENALLIEAKLDGAFLIKANLQEANLSEATLQGAFLNEAKLGKAIFLKANLQGANLSEAILQGAFLTRSCLQNANLRGANVQRADLTEANLQNANLNGANLQQADLSGARLKGAYFGKANLNRAYLIGADLDGVDLSGASLQGAYLYEADLTKAKNLELKEIESAHRDIHTLLPESIAQLAYWKQFS
jgi:uncharacterized protein YjbI with pentapeptide repeats